MDSAYFVKCIINNSGLRPYAPVPLEKQWNVWLMKSNQSPLGSEETRPWGWCDPRGGVQVGGMRPTSSPVEQGLG